MSINNNKIEIIKPLLKWVGGKTQIIDKIINEFPKEINNYHEIFLGGGSVLLALLSYQKANKIKINNNIYVYDINEVLIYLYKNIQTNHIELYNQLQEIIKEYNECKEEEINRKPKDINEAKKNKENYYYWIRDKYNKLNNEEKKSIYGSALFIFLNKTCFRGIFRISSNGFNVPYGNYKNPEIINKEHLNKINELIKEVIFECQDYRKSLENIKKDDFIYLDPPYIKENDKSFVGYTENGFNIENHEILFKIIHELTEKNIKIMLSNSDVKIIEDRFKENKYNIERIICKRTINSKNPESKTKEVLIKNY